MAGIKRLRDSLNGRLKSAGDPSPLQDCICLSHNAPKLLSLISGHDNSSLRGVLLFVTDLPQFDAAFVLLAVAGIDFKLYLTSRGLQDIELVYR